MTKDDALLAQLKEDYTQACLSPADRAMLDYAVKLTRTPAAMAHQDVQVLRDAGFGDQAILDIAQITAYFAFANRTAAGLGIAMEDFWHPDTDPQTSRIG